MRISLIITLALLLSIFHQVHSQRTLFYDDPEYTFRLALELYEKEKYVAAKGLFDAVIEKISDKNSLLRADAQYYASVSAAELKHPDAQNRITEFIESHPGHVKVPVAYFHLGKIYYERRSYRRAAEAFTNVTISELSQRQRDEYYFAAGYSWFETNDLPKAKRAFKHLKDRETRFKVYATYYYAHVCYLDQDFSEALKNFDLIKEHPDFKPLIPYYYAQILYKQERYSEMADVVTPLIDRQTTRRLGTIARLIGDAFYKLNLYEESVGYLEIYLNETGGNISRIDAYQIGYVYYQTGDHQRAVDMFQKVTYQKDSLAQSAYYHLADCYISLNEKRFALNAFYEAYKIGLDGNITEDALYNYAKLTYELAHNPYNQAVKAFEQFLGDYPNSPNAANAQTYLVNLYVSTRNYRSALTSIEKIKDQSDELRAAYQRISFFRGVELFNDNNYKKAVSTFNRSLEFVPDRTLRAKTLYWIGESYYRLEKWDSARTYYNRYQVAPGAFSLSEHNLANYNIGYTYFKQLNYDRSLIAFRKFLLKPENIRADILQDAYMRAADCYFMKKDYSNAITYYKHSAQVEGGIKTAYPIYQQALAQGATGRFQSKADLLESMIRSYPQSNYRSSALFELATTWQIIGNQTRALDAFKKLLAEYPNSRYKKEALLQTGLIYFNTGREDLALKNFDRVAREFRGTPESKEALLLTRDIYVVTDRVEEYYNYIKNLQVTDPTVADITEVEKDSLTYLPAVNYYLEGNCEEALPRFINYINKYPEGVFIIDAHFYKAECQVAKKDYEEAIKSYDFVTSRHRTKFTEAALLKAAELHFMNDNCQEALKNYIRLEQNADNRLYVQQGRIGQMRCYKATGDISKAYATASRIIREKQHPEEIITEAYFIRAKAAMEMDSIAEAQTLFEKVIKRTRNEFAAESKYLLAVIQFNMEEYEEAEREIFELINDIPSYDYWIAKAFILLADVYVKTDNAFQARHTLQSIIDNYDGEDLIIEARKKLQKILDAEKMEEKLFEEEEIQLQMTVPENIDE